MRRAPGGGIMGMGERVRTCQEKRARRRAHAEYRRRLLVRKRQLRERGGTHPDRGVPLPALSEADEFSLFDVYRPPEGEPANRGGTLGGFRGRGRERTAGLPQVLSQVRLGYRE